ncbi:MAG: NAD(P)-dependent dehydrogenase (short-subunit alcohol dehydrogenase family) [Candidatus Poriferisodalaceae bacterium]|jgi:NAD(P)-dependent dehydrogenase (short-subunit alcohol dehydrogenase family)
MQDFQGKVAVITGGASGIGLGMARAFSGAGMKLVIADLDDVALTSVVDEFRAAGTEVIGQRCDVSDHSAIQSLADATIAEFGAVHVLCNNAGVGIPTATHKMKLPDWKWIIDVCLWGPIYGIDVFLPLIEEQGEGHINSTSSMAGLVASQMMGAYNVAKHGVVALMATLERDLRGRESQVTSSVLCPGPINTNISRHSVQFRPGQAKPKTDGETSGRVARSIQDILEKGMDPDDVGLMVLDAIANDKFWVLTHPRWTKAVQRMVDAMNDDQTLSRA